jgi:hypothetical protein
VINLPRLPDEVEQCSSNKYRTETTFDVSQLSATWVETVPKTRSITRLLIHDKNTKN